MKKTVKTLIFTAIVSSILSTSVFAVDLGSRETIQQIQEALNRAGYDCGTPDGLAGGKTASAISAYRSANGLPEGTEIDGNLYQALLGDNQHTAGEVISDDECLEKTFIEYAGSLAKVSYAQVKAYLDGLGYKYETTISAEDLATFIIYCEKGSMYFGFYPLSDDEAAYGDPDQEMLSSLEYSWDDKWITISDGLHINDGTLSTGDKGREPVNQEAASLQELIDFYNNEMDGSVSLAEGVTVNTDSAREDEVSRTINSRVSEKYTDTTLEEIDVNSDLGTSEPDDFIILVHLRWDQKNGVGMTQQILEMYSDDLAATLADAYHDASEVTLFWEVPYLLESGVCAEYSYTGRDGHAYRSETVGPLYN